MTARNTAIPRWLITCTNCFLWASLPAEKRKAASKPAERNSFARINCRHYRSDELQRHKSNTCSGIIETRSGRLRLTEMAWRCLGTWRMSVLSCEEKMAEGWNRNG